MAYFHPSLSLSFRAKPLQSEFRMEKFSYRVSQAITFRFALALSIIDQMDRYDDRVIQRPPNNAGVQSKGR